MALPLPTALEAGPLPALVGFAVAFALLMPVRRAVAGRPEAKGLAMVLHALPANDVVFALVAANLAWTSTATAAPFPGLWLVGILAGATAAIQGWTAARGFPAVLEGLQTGTDPSTGRPTVSSPAFGRLLLRLVLLEVPLIVAMAWFTLRAR